MTFPQGTTSTTPAAKAPSTAAKVPPPGGDPWPRQFTYQDAKISVYQPELSDWTGNKLDAYSAVLIRTGRGYNYNAYTGNYAAGRRGAAYNPNTGVVAGGAHGVAGNAYSGSYATANRGFAYNTHLSASRGVRCRANSSHSRTDGRAGLSRSLI